MAETAPPRPGRVLLVGLMGAGKSTVGQALARRLGWDHQDSDELIRQRTGRTVPEIFRASGEAAFRSEEADVIAALATGPTEVVISVGGGAVVDPANRGHLAAAGLVVWLRATPTTLAARVGAGHDRPLLGCDPAGTLARLERERAAAYEEVADLVVDVDGTTPEQVAAQIAAHGQLGSSRGGLTVPGHA